MIFENCKSYNIITKKDKKFSWDQKCEDIFNKLKGLLTTTPILKIKYPNKDFLVCTDACNRALGRVLTQ